MKTLFAVMAMALAIAFSPLTQAQAATMSPGAKPASDSLVTSIAAKKKKVAKKKAKSKRAGSCGAYMYYSKKDRKCSDARLKK